MKLLDSLLDAIVRLEGDSLVMHVGEKPYVVTASSSMNAYRGPLAWGQVELSSRVLTFDAVSSMLGQILPADQQQALTEFGAIEHEIPSPAGIADKFTVVAARGGEDVWVEVRRRPIDVSKLQVTAEELAAANAAALADAHPHAEAPHQEVPAAAIEEPQPAAADTSAPGAAAAPEPVAVAVPGEAVAAIEPAAEAAPEASLPEPEIEVITEAEAAAPAAEAPLDTNESIVVAIPGEAAEEFALSGVPDNAIQIVDEEPQGVPTEEEVDAMLGGASSELLNSGIIGGVVTEEPEPADEPVALVVDESFDEETEIDLTLQEPVTVSEPATPEPVATMDAAPQAVAEVETPVHETPVHVDGPAFELSPPPAVEPAAADLPQETQEVAPVGTPLFSEEAVLAAAAPIPVEPEAAVVQPEPVVELLRQPAAEPIAEPVVGAQFSEPIVEQFIEPVTGDFTAPVVDQVPEPEAETSNAAPAVEFAAPEFQPTPEAIQTPVADVPYVGEPAVAEASANAPVVPEPVIAEPVITETVKAETVITETVVTETIVTETVVTELLVSDPVPAETSVAEPLPVETPAIPAYMDAAPAEVPMALEELPPLEPAPPSEDVFAAGGDPLRDVVVAPEPVVSEPAAEIVNVEDSVGYMGHEGPESTPQFVPPPFAEMPMEFTPELRGHDQSAAGFADQVPTSFGTPTLHAPEPAMHAQAPVFDPVVPANTPQFNQQPNEEAVRPSVAEPAHSSIKPEISAPYTPSEDAALMQTLRAAAARGASTVYVVAQSKPMIRIDGEIVPLESEPTLTAADVDRLVMELAPPRRRDALLNGPVEWLCDVSEIGRVRCLTFRDHRGPGVLFRMFPPRAISADQLGLTPEVQALCQQSDGLVLVAGARASGKSTLLNAFVDLINRTRSDHVITIESQIGFVHESRRSFISQRESRGDSELAATFARAALREDPDVMMIEDLKSAELVSAALEAAESGRLVIASVSAASTIGAIERLIELFPADRRIKARASLATALRGVIAQVLLRRATGGRAAAREILLNTPAVSQLVLEGKMFQLPVALDSGRRHGMVPLTDSLAAHVREGTVQVAEAYRKALDRAALVAVLKRDGIDTSFVERLA